MLKKVKMILTFENKTARNSLFAHALLQTITIKIKMWFENVVLSVSFHGYCPLNLATSFSIWLKKIYSFFKVRSAPGIAMVCFNTSFFRPPLEFQGQINSINTFQVIFLLSIQTSSIHKLNVIGGLIKTH